MPGADTVNCPPGVYSLISDGNDKVDIPRPHIIELPMTPQLIDALARTKTGDLTYLVTEYGVPFSIKGLGNHMRECLTDKTRGEVRMIPKRIVGWGYNPGKTSAANVATTAMDRNLVAANPMPSLSLSTSIRCLPADVAHVSLFWDPLYWGVTMKFAVIWASLMVTGILSATASAEIRCHCPSINAEAKGNTSCSATETGNLCTVDFNKFPGDDEQRAVEFLMKATGEKPFLPPNFALPDVETAAVVQTEEGLKNLPSLLLTYLAVSTASREDADEILATHSTFFKELAFLLAQHVEELRKAFQEAPEGHAKFSSGDLNVVITPGCIEVRATGIWVMYKAAFAAAASAPQCGD